MHLAVGDLVLTLAETALAVFTLAGLIRHRETWSRAATLLTGAIATLYCAVVQRLVATTGTPEALFWARALLVLCLPGLIVANLFTLTLGRADTAGAVRRHRMSVMVQALVGSSFVPLMFRPAFVAEYAFREGSYVIRLGDAGRIYMVFLLLGLGVVAFRLESTYRGARGQVRARLQWAALGVFGAVAYFTYLLTDGALGGDLERDALVASAVPILFCALFVAVAYVRAGLVEAGVTVGRQVIYKSMTGLVSATYIALVLAAGYLAQLMGVTPSYMTAALFIFGAAAGLAAFLFSKRLRRRMLRFVDRSFYANQPDYRAYWLRASHELVSGVGLHDLQERATTLIEDLLNARPLTIHLARRAGDPYRLMSTTGGAEPPDVDPGEPIARRLEAATEPLLIEPSARRRGSAANPELLPTYVENELFLDATEARVVAPLRTAERLIGFLTLGPRATGERYSYEDLALLETVTLQLAGAIRGAWLTEDLGAAREMEVFSQWANVVVHDLKNFVSPLKLFLQNARRHMHNPEFREQAIDDIQSVVEKMDQAIHRMTELRHGEEMSPAPIDIHWVIDGVLARSGLESRSDLQVKRHYARLPEVTADATLLDRVFSNLVNNAAEAMPGGGVLTIESSDLRDDPAGRRWAVIRVRDTGVGMAPSFVRHRLFQPFATTKKKGWGLGLYQCRSIIEAHGGSLTATSQSGVGSEFKVTLPLRHLARHEPDGVGPGQRAVARGASKQR